MESKKTFGAYILKRRKELGMTQKEFAQQLFVTESAVSKWERGLSYPDITLLQTICTVLNISEHELLTGNEDTKMRTSEKFANKYLRLTRNYRISQYILYGCILLGCGIGNLVSNHRLDWFFIALVAVLMSASLTLVPALAALYPKLNGCKVHIALGSFTAFLELLLLVCCIYTEGTWFPIAGISVLFGVTLVILPFLLPSMPLPAALAKRKTSAYLALELLLLLALLLTVCLSSSENWFPIAAAGVLLGLGFFILPVFLNQLPLPKHLKKQKLLLYFVIQTLLVLLIVVLTSETRKDFLTMGLPITLLTAFLPWAVMLSIRYIPKNIYLKLSGACAAISLWIWLFPVLLDRIMSLTEATNHYPLWPSIDFAKVQVGNQLAYNIISLLILSFLFLALLFLGLGFYKLRKHTGDAV